MVDILFANSQTVQLEGLAILQIGLGGAVDGADLVLLSRTGMPELLLLQNAVRLKRGVGCCLWVDFAEMRRAHVHLHDLVVFFVIRSEFLHVVIRAADVLQFQ